VSFTKASDRKRRRWPRTCDGSIVPLPDGTIGKRPSINVDPRLGVLRCEETQGIRDFVQKRPCALLARTGRGDNRVGAVDAKTISAAFADFAGAANRARPFLTGMDQQASRRHGEVHDELSSAPIQGANGLPPCIIGSLSPGLSHPELR